MDIAMPRVLTRFIEEPQVCRVVLVSANHQTTAVAGGVCLYTEFEVDVAETLQREVCYRSNTCTATYSSTAGESTAAELEYIYNRVQRYWYYCRQPPSYRYSSSCLSQYCCTPSTECVRAEPIYHDLNPVLWWLRGVIWLDSIRRSR